MKILLTGATGYIGKRLLPELAKQGHHLVVAVRDRRRFPFHEYQGAHIDAVEADFLEPASLESIPDDIEAAYYLIHSMSASLHDFGSMEERCARNFSARIGRTEASHVIYLGGIANEAELSPHLSSRLSVEHILRQGDYSLTALRAGIIVGSGSASFEIIRDLVEKLPLMVAPRWLNTRSQPIAVRNVIQFLTGVLDRPETYGRTYDIGGPDVMTYKEMLLRFARQRKLRRMVLTLPVMTPKLSSYWLYFVTSTTYKLAVNLVDSMKVEVVCRPNQLHLDLGIRLIPYPEAVGLAFDKIEQREVMSSWTDALSGKTLQGGIRPLLEVPEYGCLKDRRSRPVGDEEAVLRRIWTIGGEKGWYYGTWLWGLRGFIDKMAGGVGLRRGRRNPDTLQAGESLDFWRVLVASPEEKRLLLYAEMRLPGEAWLEFRVYDGHLVQEATFRPRGLLGRAYWVILAPLHYFIFKGMLKRLASS